MAKSNRDKIGDALEVLRDGLYPFVERELKAHFGKDWKMQATDDMRHTPRDNEWDASLLLNVMWNHWNVVFRNTLGHGERSLVSLTRDVRNDWAHQKTFSSDDTYRALDQMSQLLAAVSAGEQAVELDKQKMEVMRLKLVGTDSLTTQSKRAGQALPKASRHPGLSPLGATSSSRTTTLHRAIINRRSSQPTYTRFGRASRCPSTAIRWSSSDARM
jgi:hypothetical protein